MLIFCIYMFISSALTPIFLSNVVFIYLFEHPYFQIFARLVQKVKLICELIFHLLSWLSFMVFDFFICSYALGFWFTGSLWQGAFDFALCSVFLSSFLSGGFNFMVISTRLVQNWSFDGHCELVLFIDLGVLQTQSQG